ncbi:hypothetical protein V3N99_21295 [Dermatophilaceae bacterium Soc4.6]
MTACPCCFQEQNDTYRRWQCDTPSCQKPDEVAQAWLGPKATVGGSVDWVRDPAVKAAAPERTGCPTCGRSAGPACPYCHFLFPPSWLGSTTVTVAMAGARNTGKSVYVGVLIRFLTDLVGRHGSSFSWAHPLSARNYRETYEKALFAVTDALGEPVEPTIMGATPRASTESYQRFPLIMNLGTLARQRTHLILRDVAGEDLEKFAGGTPEDANLTFFASADLVVYLFDPLTVPYVAGALEGLIPRQMQQGVADPAQVLGTVLSLVQAGRPRLAVVMSKFDAVQQLRRVPDTTLGRIMIPPGSAMVRSPALTGSYDEQDAQLLHEEIRGLLHEVEADQLVRLAAHYRHRFIGLSSLGDFPLGERLSPYGISPYRVLDPLLWILAEKRLIPTV